MVIQPVTGFAIAYLSSGPAAEHTLTGGLDDVVFFADACWLPMVWLQIRMAAMAQETARMGYKLPDACWR